MTSSLLFALARLYRAEADRIQQPHAWPPRVLSDEQRREVRRLDAMSARSYYQGHVAAYEER